MIVTLNQMSEAGSPKDALPVIPPNPESPQALLEEL
jgi:hypothetical protein